MRKIFSLAALGFLVCTLPIFSQTNQKKEKEILLDEVLVQSNKVRTMTVSKINVPMELVPVSSSEISPRLIEDLRLNDINLATRYVTGVKPVNTYGGFMTFMMRGFNNFVLLVDGAREERHNLWQSAATSAVAGVDRIEVIKGASSDMFGHSALGGAINIVRKKPTAETHVDIEGQYNNWGENTIKAGFGTEVFKGLNMRADLQSSSGEGYRRTNNNFKSIYLALVLETIENNIFSFHMGANNDYFGSDCGLPVVKNDIFDKSGKLLYKKGEMPKHLDMRTRYGHASDHIKDKSINLGLRWERFFENGFKLNNLLSFSNQNNYYQATEGMSYVETPKDKTIEGHDYYYMSGNKKQFLTLDSLKRSPFAFDYNTKITQNQLDFTGDFNTGYVNHKFALGYSFSHVYFKRWFTTSAVGKGFSTPVAAINPDQNPGTYRRPYGRAANHNEFVNSVYFQDYISFGKHFSSLIGLRYDRFDQIEYTNKFENNLEQSHDGKKDRTHNNSLTWRASLMYKPTENFNLYATASTFFKPSRAFANDNTIYVNKNKKEFTPKGGQFFDPETAEQYELGAHATLGKFNIHAAAYYINKHDIVQNIGQVELDGVIKQVLGQIGRADSKGLELDLNGAITDNLYLNAGYSYVVAKYRASNSIPQQYAESSKSKSEKDLVGNYPRWAPEHSTFAWLFYNLSDLGLKQFDLGFGVEHASESFADAKNEFKFDGYVIANALAKMKVKNITLQMNVNNIFNKRYFRYAVGSNNFIPDAERTLTFTARYNF